jgi:glycosyltransferase involved in cell wall biosynthesis
MSQVTPIGARKLFFAHISSFSGVNAAVKGSLPAQMPELDIVSFDVWLFLTSRRPLLAYLVLGAFIEYGLPAIRSRNTLIEHIMKSRRFFDLATRVIRDRIAREPDVVAVLQTQGLFNAKVRGKPLVIYTDDVIESAAPRTFSTVPISAEVTERERRLFANADQIAVAASHVQNSLSSGYGRADRVHVIFEGANSPDVRNVASDRYQKRHLLFVGVDWERKGGPELVGAFLKVLPRFPDARLTIAGCRPAISHPNIDVLGRLSFAEVADLYATHSIFCMPSRLEPFGIATIEASHAGLPTIGTETGGFPDTIIHGQTGFRVPVSDIGALATALDILLADPDLCRSFGEAGRLYAAQNFTWPIVAAKLGVLITGAIEQYTARPAADAVAAPT